jgi:hypothetical protein
VVAVFDGIDEFTSFSVVSSRSYLPSDFLLGSRFKTMVSVEAQTLTFQINMKAINGKYFQL